MNGFYIIYGWKYFFDILFTSAFVYEDLIELGYDSRSFIERFAYCSILMFWNVHDSKYYDIISLYVFIYTFSSHYFSIR